MQKLVKDYLDELNKRQKKNRKVGIAVLLLIVMVVTGVVGGLTQYGVAMTGTARCGAEEHQHSGECYSKTLACGQEESKGHTHTAECQPPQEPSCGQEESAEGEEGHKHTEECYQTPEGWACGQEEGEGHTHTDACYTQELACGKEEHTHTDVCYIDSQADVEEPSLWDSQYANVQWKGNWAEDLVTAAQMQVGYKESISNYTVAENGSHKGYTRYGQFVGDPFADWDAAFVNFCLHYAGMDASGLFPSQADTAKWREAFGQAKEGNAAYVAGREGYEPKAGDIVFFQRENEETANQMGIVTSYVKGTNEITVIEGNSGNEVRENRYSAADGHIIQYVKTAELGQAYKTAGGEAGDAQEPEGTAEAPAKADGKKAKQKAAAADSIWEAMEPDEAYVNEVKVTKVSTGSAPFDETEGRGNDTTPEDKIVRTFDTVNYDFSVNMKSWDISKSYSQARVKLEFVLPLSENEAAFEQTAMAWMDQTEGYKPVLSKEARMVDGVEKECQVLTCYKLLLPSEGNHSVVPGDFGENVTIYVKGMKNGAKFAPIISAAMEGGAWDGPCSNEEHKIDGQPAVEKKSVTADEVEVTAAPKYNIQVKGDSSYADDFWFQGDDAWMQQYKDVAANTDIVKPLPGRSMKLGITLQLYNDNASKGLKGIELPDGSPITFDLKLSSKYEINTPNENSGYTAGQVIEDTAFAPLLWSYDEVHWREYGSQNKDGRKIDDRLKATPYAPYAEGEGKNACYKSGNWTAAQEGDTIHITVEGYEIDPKKMPTMNGDEGKYVTYGLNVGCFSSGEIWLIQPFNKKEGDGEKPNYDIVKTYGQGFFATTAEAGNLRVTTMSGDQLVQGENGFQQMVADDDEETRTLELTLGGYLQNRVRYGDAQAFQLGCGVSDNRDGRDYAAVGSELNLMGGLSYNPNRVEENRMYLGTTLLKFYGSALELEKEDWFLHLEGGAALNGHDETETGLAEENVRIYYATKPDGSDWASDDELKLTYEDQLEFYDSLDKIPAGKTCVGMLISFIGPGGEVLATDPYYRCYHKARVKDDMDLAGKTFMLASTSRVWTKEMFEKAGMGLETLDLTQNPGLSIPELVLKPEMWKVGHYTSANIDGSVFYQKEVYRADGSGIEGKHNSDWYHWGDTLLIIGYKTKITKNLQQADSNGEEKKVFNLDADQRVVDFKLQPGTYYDKPGEFEHTARITIVDTLPKHLTYKPGSAYFGGAYEQTSVNGGTKGNIIKDTEAGAAFPNPVLTEPKVTKNADGTQTLTWIIEDVKIGSPMAPIYYSTDIGVRGNPEEDVPTGTTDLKNVAYITTPRDLRDPMATAEKHAEAGISATRGSASSFGKYTKQKVVDEDGAIDYVVYYNNNADTGASLAMMDTMPMDGVNGSHFTGTYTFAEWKLDTSKCDAGKIRIYYSFDTKYQDKTTQSVPKEEIESWKQAAIREDGTITIPTEADGATKAQPYPVAWGVVGALDSGKSVNISLKIQLDPGASEKDKENNYFVNLLSSGDTTTTTENPTVKRTLEGLAWMDYNRDGIQDDIQTETRISGIKVELLRLKEGGNPEDENSYENVYFPGKDKTAGNEIAIETGKQISVRAGEISEAAAYEQGRYKFTDLPAGMFAVRFTDGSGETKISKLNATVQDCGVDDTLDSDGMAVYDDNGILQKTLILGLEMPEAKDMSVALYESKNHDSGFYPNTLLEIRKVDGSGQNSLQGAIFTIQDASGKTLSFAYEEGKGYLPVKEEEGDPSLNGKYYIAFANDPSYVVEINGNWDGAEPVLKKRNGNELQLFEVRSQGGDLYSFLNVGSNKWLDLDGGDKWEGAKIHVWSNDIPNDNQKWHVTDVDGGSYIWPSTAGNANEWRIDLNGGNPSEGEKIHLWSANDSPAQKWILVHAGVSGNGGVKGETDLSVGSDGALTIRDLVPGVYTITEIKSPIGYSLLKEPAKFTLHTDGTVTSGSSMLSVAVKENENASNNPKDPDKFASVSVHNEKLYALPSTGGTGIYLYMLGGVLLMSAALLITYKNKCKGVLRS